MASTKIGVMASIPCNTPYPLSIQKRDFIGLCFRCQREWQFSFYLGRGY